MGNTRRSFLKTIGLGSIATVAATTAAKPTLTQKTDEAIMYWWDEKTETWVQAWKGVRATKVKAS